MPPPDRSPAPQAEAPRTAPPTASPTASPAASAAPARIDVGLAFGRYTLALPRDARARLALGWFALGVAALAASGVLAILLVLSRTPWLAKLFPVADFFHAALVAHVDLSVLVWFLAFAGTLWSLNSTPRLLTLGRSALACAALGAAIIAIAPFAGGTPIMANYVPVIEGRTFLTGLVVFGIGVALLVARGLFASPLVGMRLDGSGALRFGLNGAIVATAVALLAFGWSFATVPATLDGKAYYELVFWSGGHVLQFTWTLLLLVAWLLLADTIGARVPLSPRVAALLFGIGLAAVFATPPIFLAYDVTTVEHHRLQTWLMRFGGSLAIVPVAAAVILALAHRARHRRALAASERPLFAALVTSIALFGVGGLIGFAIHGSNVKIPAHYHGSIVGVTIGMMGLAYWLLPRLGFASPAPRLAAWQAYLYGGGQLLHVVGLLWSGGYGVQRKVADGAAVERSFGQVAGMGLMGLGGLIAVIGGMLFVAVVAISVIRRPRGSASATARAA
jgi:hypothetical protein